MERYYDVFVTLIGNKITMALIVRLLTLTVDHMERKHNMVFTMYSVLLYTNSNFVYRGVRVGPVGPAIAGSIFPN